jgi:hypothetical protein
MYKNFIIALVSAVVMAAPTEDKMDNLPDAPAFTTNTYSGYL